MGRSRTSFGGSSSEPIEEALSRIIGDDGFNSFKTGVDSVNKTEFAERAKALRSGLAEALAKSTLDVMSKAKENIMQQERAMAETLEQLEDTAEVRVQSDTAAARMALANAEQVMSQENAKELRRIVDLHHRTFAAREAIYEEKFKVHSQARDQFQHLQKYLESGSKKSPLDEPNLLLVPPQLMQRMVTVNKKERLS